MSDQPDPQRLAEQLDEQLETHPYQGLPPVDLWNPPLTGDIDIRIARDGQWYFNGDLMQRQALVNLFSTILKREGDEYFLVTPVEKFRIRVEDEAFVANDLCMETDADGVPCLSLTTNTGESLVIGPEHPLRVMQTEAGEPQPSIKVRRNLYARLSRSSFYHLVDIAEETQIDGHAGLGVWSQGVFFPLGIT